MSRSYSTDLRIRVIEAISGGLSTRQAAARFGIGVSTAVTWYRLSLPFIPSVAETLEFCITTGYPFWHA